MSRIQTLEGGGECQREERAEHREEKSRQKEDKKILAPHKTREEIYVRHCGPVRN